jgi:hypothetical protein
MAAARVASAMLPKIPSFIAPLALHGRVLLLTLGNASDLEADDLPS